jgi:hypothetical protein
VTDNKVLPSAYQERLSGCIEEGMGSDIRIKSKVDEHSLGPDEKLPPMTLFEGFEIRILDNSPIKHLPQIYRFIVLIAEASRLHEAPEFIYDNQAWASAIQSVMREGWNAILPQEYISDLLVALDLRDVNFEQKQAYQVFQRIFEALWEKHAGGMWTGLLLDDIPQTMPLFTNPNRESWEIGATNMGITPFSVLDILGLPMGSTGEVRVSDLQIHVDFGLDCTEDVEDFIYLAEKFGRVDTIILESDGSVESFRLLHQSN